MFTPTILKTVLGIDQLVTISCFELERDFIFKGKKHNFWEFIYIEKGEAGILADSTEYVLKEDEIIFHQPNEHHQMRAITANVKVVNIVFVCRDKAMSFFNKKVLSLDIAQKSLLSLILKEAAENFSSQLNVPFQAKLIKKKNAPFGGEQLIKTYLEQFLISLVRSDSLALKKADLSEKNENEDRIVEAIVHYLKSNITNQLYLDDICKNICFSKSYIKQLFSRKKGEGIMQFFTSLKIDESKRLLREESLNITQISEMLGFSSVHYFSRVFKNRTGVSPRAYLKSVNKNSLL
jgi:AraC-like DNA-binding protein